MGGAGITLTSGKSGVKSHIFSNKDLAALILPLIAEQFLVLTLGLADIIMVAELGEEAVSAASLGDSINVLIAGLFGALATGGAVVCAHCFGSKDTKMLGLTAKQLIYTTIFISLLLTITGLVFKEPLLRLIFGNIEDNVMEKARVYFFYSLLSYPFLALYSACAALFRTQGNSRISMFASILINILNIGGNALCIFKLRWGIEGVAIPTLVARAAAAAFLFAFLYQGRQYRGNPGIDVRKILKIQIKPHIIKNILHIGIPNGIENSVFQIGKILVLTIIAQFGTSAVAANAAAATLVTFQALPGTAMGFALITVVGRALGGGGTDEAVALNKKLILIAYICMIAINIPMLLCTAPLISFFRLQADTARLAASMFVLHGVFSMLIWPLSFVLPASLRAANDAKFTMIVSFASMWLVRVGLSVLLVRLTNRQAMCVWYAMIIDWFVRSAFFVTRWQRGGWKRKYRFE